METLFPSETGKDDGALGGQQGQEQEAGAVGGGIIGHWSFSIPHFSFFTLRTDRRRWLYKMTNEK